MLVELCNGHIVNCNITNIGLIETIASMIIYGNRVQVSQYTFVNIQN